MAQEAERLGLRLGVGRRGLGHRLRHASSPGSARRPSGSSSAARSCRSPARTPANTAMTAATLDLLSGGRFLLGLGTSGPQVVEGWHGEPWGKPLAKTREYVEIVRTALRRELVEHHGEHYDIPYSNGTGLGKPLKLMARPLRADIPIYLAAMGPEGRRAGVRDRGRLAPDLLVAREGARGLRRRRSRARATGLRHRADRAGDPDRRRRGRARVPQAVLRALHRRHGRARQELLQRPLRALRLRGRGDERSRISTSTGTSATRPPRYLTRSSTRSRSSGRRSGSPSGSTRGASRARRRSSSRRSSPRRCARSPRSRSEPLALRRARSPRPRFGEVRHAPLEARSALVLGAELAPHVAAVDRLAEDGRLPERERLEPAKRLDVAAAARDVALDELLPRREAGQGGHRRRPERVRRRRPARCTSRAGSRRRRAGRRSRPSPSRARRGSATGRRARPSCCRVESRRARPSAAAARGRCPRASAPTSLDLRELTRLVDLPELGEAPDLTLVVAPGPRERRQAGRRDVGGVDLDERVDEVVAETTARRLALESRRQLVRRNVRRRDRS